MAEGQREEGLRPRCGPGRWLCEGRRGRGQRGQRGQQAEPGRAPPSPSRALPQRTDAGALGNGLGVRFNRSCCCWKKKVSNSQTLGQKQEKEASWTGADWGGRGGPGERKLPVAQASELPGTCRRESAPVSLGGHCQAGAPAGPSAARESHRRRDSAPGTCHIHNSFQEDIFLLLRLRAAPRNPESIKPTEGAERRAPSSPPGSLSLSLARSASRCGLQLAQQAPHSEAALGIRSRSGDALCTWPPMWCVGRRRGRAPSRLGWACYLHSSACGLTAETET